jgi:hypothetical protein
MNMIFLQANIELLVIKTWIWIHIFHQKAWIWIQIQRRNCARIFKLLWSPGIDAKE